MGYAQQGSVVTSGSAHSWQESLLAVLKDPHRKLGIEPRSAVYKTGTFSTVLWLRLHIYCFILQNKGSNSGVIHVL